MINFTPLSKPYFAMVYKAEQKARQDVEQSQMATLHKLIAAGVKTEYGEERGFSPTDSYLDFLIKAETASYESFRPEIERMIRGEKGILWPGVCRRFAQSSGTSGGKSKYIPLTDESLNGCHYPGAAYSLASYLHHYQDSRLFGGKNFILGGSYANELQNLSVGVKVGDLSASLIDRINPLVNLFRVPDKKTALMSDWHQKLPRLAEIAAKADIRSISGVPSWFLAVLKQVLELTGASNIHEVWPNLEVFFHGGIAFSPYREQYQRITNSAKMRYWENYNASEGFFAVQENPDSPEMGLLMNANIFYEFDEVGGSGYPVPAWQVEVGKVYELLITSTNGLWRYRIGDTVKVHSVNPLTITIAGRTKSFINAFGEELMVYNAEAAMARVTSMTSAEVLDYTAAPVYAGDHTRGRHQWLIEFAKQPDCGVKAFAELLDQELQKENSDYQAKRSGDLFLDCLEIIPATPGVFNRWLASTGKLGGQRKVPRLSNDRSIIEPLLKMNNLNS